MYVVLPKCLRVMHAGTFFNTREGFTSVLGTNWGLTGSGKEYGDGDGVITVLGLHIDGWDVSRMEL